MTATNKACVLKRIFDGKVQMRISFAGNKVLDILYSFFCDSNEHMKIRIFDIVENGTSFFVEAKKHTDVMTKAKAVVWVDVEKRAEIVLIRKWCRLRRSEEKSSKNLSKAIKSLTKKSNTAS